MEVDCLDVLNLWSSRHNSRVAVAPILDEVGELAMHFLLLLRIKHIRREANNSADLCAKHACSLTLFLVHSLLADCNRLSVF